MTVSGGITRAVYATLVHTRVVYATLVHTRVGGVPTVLTRVGGVPTVLTRDGRHVHSCQPGMGGMCTVVNPVSVRGLTPEESDDCTHHRGFNGVLSTVSAPFSAVFMLYFCSGHLSQPGNPAQTCHFLLKTQLNPHWSEQCCTRLSNTRE